MGQKGSRSPVGDGGKWWRVDLHSSRNYKLFQLLFQLQILEAQEGGRYKDQDWLQHIPTWLDCHQRSCPSLVHYTPDYTTAQDPSQQDQARKIQRCGYHWLGNLKGDHITCGRICTPHVQPLTEQWHLCWLLDPMKIHPHHKKGEKGEILKSNFKNNKSCV